MNCEPPQQPRFSGTLADARLRYRIVTETFESESWFEGNPASLMEALRRAQESLTQDDIVEKTAKALSTHLESVAKLWIGQPGACDRFSHRLLAHERQSPSAWLAGASARARRRS